MLPARAMQDRKITLAGRRKRRAGRGENSGRQFTELESSKDADIGCEELYSVAGHD